MTEPFESVGPDDERAIATEVADALAALDPDQLTPREALDALYRLKRVASGEPVR